MLAPRMLGRGGWVCWDRGLSHERMMHDGLDYGPDPRVCCGALHACATRRTMVISCVSGVASRHHRHIREEGRGGECVCLMSMRVDLMACAESALGGRHTEVGRKCSGGYGGRRGSVYSGVRRARSGISATFKGHEAGLSGQCAKPSRRACKAVIMCLPYDLR